MASLDLVAVHKRFGGKAAVDEVTLSVRDNELFCLFGPPACGKTTLLKLLVGLEVPDKGRILIGGKDMTRAPPAERDLAMVFQNLALFPHMTVRDNLAFPLVERRVPRAVIDARVAEVAATLHIDTLLKKFPAQLSGGERQRVAISRAFVRDPNAFLLDEPLSALDARLREEMRIELNRLRRHMRHTFVYVTHDQEEAMAIADRMGVMRDGRIVQIGTPLELYNAPAGRYVAEQLGTPPINIFAGSVTRQGVFQEARGRFALQTDSGTTFDGAASLGVRPEDLIVQGEPSGPVRIPGTVVALEPLGATTIIDVRAGDAIYKAQAHGQSRLTAGAAVHLSFADPAKCHLFGAGTEMRIGGGMVVTDLDQRSRQRTRSMAT